MYDSLLILSVFHCQKIKFLIGYRQQSCLVTLIFWIRIQQVDAHVSSHMSLMSCCSLEPDNGPVAESLSGGDLGKLTSVTSQGDLPVQFNQQLTPVGKTFESEKSLSKCRDLKKSEGKRNSRKWLSKSQQFRRHLANQQIFEDEGLPPGHAKSNGYSPQQSLHIDSPQQIDCPQQIRPTVSKNQSLSLETVWLRRIRLPDPDTDSSDVEDRKGRPTSFSRALEGGYSSQVRGTHTSNSVSDSWINIVPNRGFLENGMLLGGQFSRSWAGT
jgi:hypothetical protein